MIEKYILALLDWWRLKFLLQNKEAKGVFCEGEVWWCSMGLNISIDLPNRRSSIMLNQARIVDKKRLRNKIVDLDIADFHQVRTRFHEFYCL